MKDNSPIYQRLFFFIFWVGATFGFITDEIVTELASSRSMVMLGLDALWVLLACCTVRKRAHLAGIAVILVFSGVATCMTNGLSLFFWANGMRDFLGIMLAYPVMCYFMGDERRREQFEPALDRHVLYFLLAQAVCGTYQFVEYGGGDHCGGSFGNWYSGQVSMCIYIGSYYLVHKNLDTDHFFSSLRDNKLPIILLFPTFLNETKISFVLIAIYIVLLIPIDRKLLARALWMLPGAVLLGWAAISVYVSVTGGEDIFSMDYIEKYVMVEDMDAVEGGALWEQEQGVAADVPRFTKIMYLAVLYEQEPGHEMQGWGVGQFKGGNGMEISEFAYQYDWLLSGSVPYMFHVVIQLGWVGLVLVVLWLIVLFLLKPAWSVRRDFNTQVFVMLVLLIIMGYNDSLRDLWMCMFTFMLMASSWKPAWDEDCGEDESDDNNEDESLTPQIQATE